MWLTLTGHITMWPTSKEFTSVTKLVHITMWLRLNEFWGLIMFCLWESFFLSTGLQHSDPYVLRKSLGHIVNAASTLHLELFQMVAPLCVSGLLLRVTQIGVKACIDVTLYAELFITSIIEKHVLYLLQGQFWPLSNDPFLDHSCTPWLTHGKAHFRCGTQHSIL